LIQSGNLFRLQSKLTVNNKTLPVVTLEKDYILTWILIGISKTKTHKQLVFKGGTALKKFFFNNYRFSEDLDFTLLKNLSIEELEDILEKVYSIVQDESNIQLAFGNKEKHKNSYIFYINYTGPLGADITKRQIKLDFTVDEKLIFSPIMRTLHREHKEYKDIPENIKLLIYPLKEIFIEKYISILDKARNEPRDIYDLWYLVSKEQLKYDLLAPKIKEKGKYKGIKNFDMLAILNKKEKNYKTLWEKRLSDQLLNLPYFDEVYRELKRSLRTLNEFINNLKL